MQKTPSESEEQTPWLRQGAVSQECTRRVHLAPEQCENERCIGSSRYIIPTNELIRRRYNSL